MPKYRFKTMNEEYDNLTARIKAGGELSVFEQKYAIAQGHAIDLSQFARNNQMNERVRLDFTIQTEKKLDKALSLLGTVKLKEGFSEEECIDYLVGMCSSYQLFALCNYVEEFIDTATSEFSVEVTIGYDEQLSENLILKSTNCSGVEIVFDPKQALEKVVDKCIFFVNNEMADKKRGLVIGLDGYRKLVIEDFLSELGK